MDPKQHWAGVIRDGSSEAGVKRVILAVNGETAMRRANQADVIVGCCQILGQSIVPGGPEIAAEIRQGIMALIDGFAIRVALASE